MSQNSVVSVVDKFLSHKKPGSRALYKYGLAEFQKFYEPQRTIEDLDRVEQYLKQTSWSERQEMLTPTDVLKNFTEYLKTKGLSPERARGH